MPLLQIILKQLKILIVLLIATVITWDLVVDEDQTIVTSAYLLRGQSYEAMNFYKAAVQDYGVRLFKQISLRFAL